MQTWLRQGSSGDQVVRWQTFLRGVVPKTNIVVDGDFGPNTVQATKVFQQANRIEADGVVGQQTLIAAAKKGYQLAHDPSEDVNGPNWPPKPTKIRQMTPIEREQTFGRFDFAPAPTSSNPEGIVIKGDWEKKNIVYVNIPQIDKVVGKPRKVGIHVKAQSAFVGLWDAWEKEGLLDKVLTFNGAYVPRFIRGSQTNLSNHSWGTAFDINPQWNSLGTQPALVGEKGCVRDLVEIATEHGWFWGGWFPNHKDGMHFELCKVMNI